MVDSGKALSPLPHSSARIAHYAVEEQIGGGLMTAVFRARDTGLDRTVALKVLLQGADATTRERFRREARTAAMLEHPNIVRTYQVGEVPESALSYIAMEYVSGPSLADLLQEYRTLSAADAASLAEPIARALAYAHERGIVHRDVKPSNILLRTVDAGHPLKVDIQDGSAHLVPMLSDFGIARALDSPELTSEGRTIGTPAYMSPEQCAGNDDIDGRSDIYALGTVLYRCLVGKPPFAGATTQILHAHVYESVLIPSEAVRVLPDEALLVLQRSMAKAPEDRYSSAAEMANDLVKLRMHTPSSSADAQEGDTRTLERSTALPVANAGGTTSAGYVLIPARGAHPDPEPAKRLAIPPPAATHVGRAPGPTRREVGRSRRTRLGITLLSVALIALTIMLAITLLSGVIPAMTGVNQKTPPPAPSAQAGAPTVAADGGATAVATTPSEVAVISTVTGETPTPDVTARPSSTPTASPTATQPPPLEVSLEYAWQNAREFYAEEDWAEALTWLVAVERADADFQHAVLANMLAETYVALAFESLAAEDYDRAVQLLNSAIERTEEPEPYAELLRAAEAVADADETEADDAEQQLQRAFEAYAGWLADEGRYCDATEQIANAINLGSTSNLRAARKVFEDECEQEQIAEVRKTLTGRILFSSEERSQYNIFEVGVTGTSTPQLLIENGAQPAMDPGGASIAYFSRRSDSPGLFRYSVDRGLGPDDRGTRLTSYVEDSRDSAPSWNPQGDRVAYGSTNFGDGRSRIYLAWADGTRSTEERGLGKDPGWSPTADIIVYNGTDETGNNPGLWMMRTDGTQRTRLTDNGNDQRPVWTPDGSAVVFMSSGRDGNWELYRVDVDSARITRLTNHVAQDGLPSVSPDGANVAFVSDRDGFWRIWFVPIDGGEAAPLADIVGELPKWLEHSIQWVK